MAGTLAMALYSRRCDRYFGQTSPLLSKETCFQGKPTVEPLSILSLGITALSKLVPALSQMFPGGSR